MSPPPSRQAGMTIEERERLVRVESGVNNVSMQVTAISTQIGGLSGQVATLAAIANQGKGGLRVLLVVGGGLGGAMGLAVSIITEWLLRR